MPIMPISHIIPSFSLYCPAFLLGQFIQHLGILRLISFFGHPWPISFFPTSFIPMGFWKILWASLTQLLHPSSLGLLAFEPISFTNSFLWAPPTPFFFLSISYDSHGLTTSFFRASSTLFAFFGATFLFCGPMDHYSYHSSPMFVTLLLSFSTIFILLGFFCPWALLSKNGHQQLEVIILCKLGTKNEHFKLQLLYGYSNNKMMPPLPHFYIKLNLCFSLSLNWFGFSLHDYMCVT